MLTPHHRRRTTDLAALLVRHGYRAVEAGGLREASRDAVAARMLGRRAVVVSGEAGCRTFYDETLVERAGAVTAPLAWLLFGRGAVHGLDDQEHRQRKQHFLDQLGPQQVASCARRAEGHLRELLDDWRPERPVHDVMVEVYGRAVLDWVGVELHAARATDLARDYATIVNGFGFAGADYLRAWRARRRTDRWAESLIADVREGRVVPPDGSWLRVTAGLEVPAHTAAVELGNVIRPTIAVAWLAAFAAAALAASPTWRERLARPGADPEIWSFCQEVRRTAPFVPALAGRMRSATSVDGVELRAGDHIVLDVRGINVDPALHPIPRGSTP